MRHQLQVPVADGTQPFNPTGPFQVARTSCTPLHKRSSSGYRWIIYASLICALLTIVFMMTPSAAWGQETAAESSELLRDPMVIRLEKLRAEEVALQAQLQAVQEKIEQVKGEMEAAALDRVTGPAPLPLVARLQYLSSFFESKELSHANEMLNSGEKVEILEVASALALKVKVGEKIGYISRIAVNEDDLAPLRLWERNRKRAQEETEKARALTVPLASRSILPPPSAAPPPPRYSSSKPCCRICRSGKACGDSCISRSKTCRKPPGCACNG